MRQGEAVLVDSGAWIALALSRGPLHRQAREQWDLLQAAGAKLHTCVPIVIETFTFLDRNANRDVALAWKQSIYRNPKSPPLRVARFGTIVGILPPCGSAQALGRRCHEFCDHEARGNSACIHVRPPLCRGRVQAGGMRKRNMQPWWRGRIALREDHRERVSAL
jgi:hypothetical protein